VQDRRGRSDAAEAPVLRALVRPLRRRMEELELSQGQVALKARCDRSRVSRVLSGRELPPLQLTLRVAAVLGVDTNKVRRRWARADSIRRREEMCRKGGGPPQDMLTYQDLLTALRNLLAGYGISQRELVRRDCTGTLTRSTVGAVLRGERSARREVVAAMVAACGVSQAAASAWQEAWHRIGLPHQRRVHQRRCEGYEIRQAAERMDWL
jgi:transcriptional regulator with XRE-family HTH domain